MNSKPADAPNIDLAKFAYDFLELTNRQFATHTSPKVGPLSASEISVVRDFLKCVYDASH